MKQLLLTGLILVSIIGCGGPATTVFLHPEFDFQFVERVAVIPLDNLSGDQGAGARTTRMFLSELFATEAFDVVEPGEVTKVLGEYVTTRTSDLTTEQIRKIGAKLNVQGLFLGAITESSSQRSGGSTVSNVTLVLRLVETERGVTVWSATAASGGKGFWSSLFGTGNKTNSEVTRASIRKALGSLIR